MPRRWVHKAWANLVSVVHLKQVGPAGKVGRVILDCLPELFQLWRLFLLLFLLLNNLVSGGIIAVNR